MEKSPKISCIMCVYNTKESDLREAIESILNQTFQDFELIIVDDGSTQPYIKQTIQSYTDSRIKYFYKENQGKVGFARNVGNAIAIGEYIAVMDSDDISALDRFQKEADFLDAHPDYFCVSGKLQSFPVKETWGGPECPCLLDCLETNPINHGPSMYRRSDVVRYNLCYGTQQQVGEDYYFWTHALMKGLKFYNLQDLLYFYRRDGRGIMMTGDAKEIGKDNATIQSEIIDFLAGQNPRWKRFLEASLESTSRYVAYFCKIPLVKIKIKGNVKRYYLFQFIPILRIEKK